MKAKEDATTNPAKTVRTSDRIIEAARALLVTSCAFSLILA